MPYGKDAVQRWVGSDSRLSDSVSCEASDFNLDLCSIFSQDELINKAILLFRYPSVSNSSPSYWVAGSS